MLSLADFSNSIFMFSGTVVKESMWEWMSSVLMERWCTLLLAASSPDPFDSFIMEMPSMMESKSGDQASNNSRYVVRHVQLAILFT